MAKRISELKVSKISLLTSEHQPAVEKAGIGFSILKFFKKSGEKVEKKHDEETLSRLDAIIAKNSKPQAEEPNALDTIIEKMELIHKKTGWDTTEDMYRYRLREPGEFEKDSFRTIQLNKTGKTIKSVMGRLKGETKMTMQNVMFPKDDWTLSEAKKWIKDHKDTLGK